MIKSIASTIVTRVLAMAMAFFIVVLNTNNIGAEGQGTVALISLGILLVVAINNFVGGTAVVYLASRVAPGQLLAPSLLWSLVTFGVFWLLLPILNIVPAEYTRDVLVLSFIQSLFTFQQQLLMGRRKIHAYNATILAQMTALLVALLYCYKVSLLLDPWAYIDALYVSFSITLLVGVFANFSVIRTFTFSGLFSVMQRLIRHGIFGQASNVIQLLINRLMYVILDRFTGRADVGLFSVTMQLNEAALAPSKSMATVQFAEISNTTSEKANVDLTVNFLKISTLITALAALALALVPEDLFIWVFGEDLIGLSELIRWLVPGMIAMSISGIMAHHFSGTGRFYLNTIGSLIALGTLALLGYAYIPDHGVLAAAICMSATFVIQGVFFLAMFIVQDKPNVAALWGKIDWGVFKNKS